MKKVDERYFIRKPDEPATEDIDAVLAEGENILWRGKPLKKAFVWNSALKFMGIAILWLLFDGFAIGMFASFPGMPWFLYIVIGVFFLFHLIPVWLWIYSMVTAGRRHKMEEYAFTDRRIIVRKGMVGARVQSILYSDLTSVNLRVGIIEKLCKVGDIYIVAGKETAVLEDLEDPQFLYSRLQGIANDIKSDILYPNALRPGENPGYKTSYREEGKK